MIDTIVQYVGGDENPNDGQRPKLGVATNDTFKGEFNDIEHLSEKEQKHPVAWKWAYNELNRLKRVECDYLILKDKYAEIDKNFAVFKEGSRQNFLVDILSSILLAVGPAMLGLMPSVGVHEDDAYVKWIFCALGCLFLLCAIIIKCLLLKNHEYQLII